MTRFSVPFMFSLLVSMCFAVFLGLPFVRQGYFFQTEMTVATFWILGGLGYWVLLDLARRKEELFKKVVSLPVVWGWGLLGMLSLISASLSPNPLKSLTGIPALGEGIFTFFSFASLTAIAVIVLKTPYRVPLLWIAVVTGLMSSALTVIGAQSSPFLSFRFWQWALIFYADYVVLIALAIVIMLYKLRPPLLVTGVICVLLFFLCRYSGNESFFPSFFALPLFYAVTRLTVFSKIQWARFCLIGGIVSITSLTLAYSFCVPYLPKTLTTIFGTSFLEREFLAKVTYYHLLHTPFDGTWIKEVLFGHGWGNFSNAILKNAFLLEDVSMYSGDKFSPNLDFVKRDLLHSHNNLTEFFLATGLIGAGAFLMIKIKILRNLSQKDFWWGTFFLFLYMAQIVFWFELPMNWPFGLIAFAALFSKPVRPFPTSFLLVNGAFVKSTKLLAGTFLVIGGLFHAAQAIILQQYWFKNQGATFSSAAEDFLDAPFKVYDGMTGATRMVDWTRKIVSSFHATVPKSSVKDQQKAFNLILQIAHILQNYGLKGDSCLALLNANNFLGELATHKIYKDMFQTQPELFDQWSALTQSINKAMPARGDLLIPYLNYLLFNNRTDELQQLAEEMIEKNPKDCVARWFLGTLEILDDSTKNQGICRLKKSIKFGIGRFMPVPESARNMIQEKIIYCTGDE